jgi:hypothetical protein
MTEVSTAEPGGRRNTHRKRRKWRLIVEAATGWPNLGCTAVASSCSYAAIRCAVIYERNVPGPKNGISPRS